MMMMMSTTTRGGTRRKRTDDDKDNNNNNAKGGNPSNKTIIGQRYTDGDTSDLAIGILRADQGSYMLRLPLRFALAFDPRQ
jgi:hypothetical protein